MMHKTEHDIHDTTEVDNNIFGDLGFDPQEAIKLKIKAKLMAQISEWIWAQDLKQENATRILQITRPRVLDIMTGKIGKFTIDALVDMLLRTGKHVTVNVS